jgi:hypothetical protein
LLAEAHNQIQLGNAICLLVDIFYLLATLLFLVDWYVPQSVAEPLGFEVDRSIIRIHSAHGWPEAVTIDTSVKPIDQAPHDDLLSSAIESNLPEAAKPRNTAFAYAPAALDPIFRSPKRPPPKAKRAGSRLARSARNRARQVARDQIPQWHFSMSEW